jgi:hypothetical protein
MASEVVALGVRDLLVHPIHDDQPSQDNLRSAVESRLTELTRWLDLTVSEAPHET